MGSSICIFCLGLVYDYCCVHVRCAELARAELDLHKAELAKLRAELARQKEAQ